MDKQSLQQIIDEILTQEHENCYIRYESSQNVRALLRCDIIRDIIFANSKASKRKIKTIIINLLHSSSKENLPINDLFDLLNETRLRHTLICYLYGCYIYHAESSMSKMLDDFIGKLWEKSIKTPQSKFLLTWLLICLFHDVGYAIEEGMLDAKVLKKVLRIYHLVDVLKINREISDLISPFPENFVPCYKETPMKYDRYRKCHGIILHKKPVYDHGIYGGILLKKALKNMPDKYGMPKKYYEYVEWVIMCHNMWFAQDENAKYVYDLLGMGSLCVQKQQYLILFDKHPLLWLLSIVDNIECTKRKVSIKWLKEIIIDELSPELLKIKIGKEAKKGRHVGEYVKALEGLNDWLLKTEVE